MASERAKVAVLVGAGHAHLHIVKHASRFAERGHRLVVIGPNPFWYSGLATGVLGGRHEPEHDQVDVAGLAERHGAVFHHARVTGLDRGTRTVHLSDGPSVAFDAVSINLGSAPPPIDGEDATKAAYRVKPVIRLADLRRDLEADFSRGLVPKVVIAGGGATAAELAGNVAGLAARNGARIEVTLAAATEPFGQLPRGAAQAVCANFAARGIVVRPRFRVVRIGDGQVFSDAGQRLFFDRFVNATGLNPRPLPSGADLPTAPDGALRVDRFLRSPADPCILGGGDGVAVEGETLQRIGVYAIREAPILLDNLLACLDGAEPTPFRPQKQFLWILNLGDGTAIAMRGKRWWRGRSALWLKDWIDRRFLEGLRS